MGLIRTGARTFLDVVHKACKLSHTPGFRTGLIGILGPTQANALLGYWDPLCVFVEGLVALDNAFNRVDHTDEAVGDEDLPEEV